MQASKTFGDFTAALTVKTEDGFSYPYLDKATTIKVNIPRIGKRKPWRHASPKDYHEGRINYTSCWNKDTLVLNGGTYQNMVLITNCRIDTTRGVGFNNMTLITTEGGGNSIEARHGLRLGNKSTACSSNIGTVFITKGGIDAKIRSGYTARNCLPMQTMTATKANR